MVLDGFVAYERGRSGPTACVCRVFLTFEQSPRTIIEVRGELVRCERGVMVRVDEATCALVQAVVGIAVHAIVRNLQKV